MTKELTHRHIPNKTSINNVRLLDVPTDEMTGHTMIVPLSPHWVVT